MKVIEINAKKVIACAGSFALIAEALVETDDLKDAYVTVQYYDGEEYTVGDKSLYAFLAGNGKPPEEFSEEYTSAKAAGASAYAKVFDRLRKVIKMLGVM